MVLIKKNVLSASIATVLLGSTGAFAANDRGFTSDTDWSEEQAALMDMLVLHLNMRPKALITI
nr:hypothetical protein [Escherichia coli]